ncbi:TfoX/Sxy family protein [Arthrobacter sp. B10-11]|uniref:TfoX/Sxy family protein n=1 Tax=Arthrobacter sp. B10-11 TaxID=3081160 RepID=UPI00295371BE|nr:TfoX/Sxy family protein [Arthrobacter sp. B10-11]MDV8149036.1 TfoX/Sxy family protein [Arthrobacter sp. B10-11]
MEMAKPTEADKEQFRSLVSGLPGIDVKPMFGNLGAFVNGNMFAGLFGSTLGLRLADADREELAGSRETLPFGPAERPMGGYVGLPVQGPPEEIEPWLARALAHVAALAPKVPKTAKAPKAPKVPKPKTE